MEIQVTPNWIAYIGGPILLAAWGWASGKIPKFIAQSLADRLAEGLKGAGIEDEDVKKYIQQITYATVVLAEAKFPDKGMGKEKLKLVTELLSNTFPFLSSFLKNHGTHLEELINKTVIEMDKSLLYLTDKYKHTSVIAPLPIAPKIKSVKNNSD